jgi:SAM-dependent methyltransferase
METNYHAIDTRNARDVKIESDLGPERFQAQPIGKCRMRKLVTQLVTTAFSKRAAQIQKDPGAAGPGLLDRMVKAGLYHRAVARDELEHLTWYHREYWKGDRALGYFQADQSVDQKPLLIEQLELTCRIAELLQSRPGVVKRVYEIGSGDGRSLRHLYEQFPNLSQYIGLDVNAIQNVRNREHYADTPIQFITADANEWVTDHAQCGSLFVTVGGVLEYFSPRELRELFSHIAHQLEPSAFAIIEPLCDNHDLEKHVSSRMYGDENSFSHNYPYLLRQAGFSVQSFSENHAYGYRWIVLMATTP